MDHGVGRGFLQGEKIEQKNLKKKIGISVSQVYKSYL